MQQYTVTGMHCAACSASVEKAVKKVPGVTSCAVSLLTNSMGVEGTAEPAAVIKAVEDAGYGASVRGQEATPAADASALEDRQTPHLKKRLIASVAFLLILMYFSMGHMMWGWPLPSWFDGNHVAMGLVQLLLAGIVMVINQEFFVSGTKSLLRGSPNMDTLVSLGAAASYGWSVYALFAMTDAQLHGGSEAAMAYMDEFYFESAAMILTLITVGKLLEAQRIRERTLFDLEMLHEVGFCKGIENYSRHLAGGLPGEPPPTLIDYLPKDALMFFDESHVLLGQIGGMYRGDSARKETLVTYGFRLPSAKDNRPLRFDEFESKMRRAIFVSATPADYELNHSSQIVEQVVRPTGLVDPEVEVRPATAQVDDVLGEIKERIPKGQRILITTLTKRMAEDLTDFLQDNGIKVRYLHSDIDTVERVEIIRDLRAGVFDVLIGINLLREGLDIPEVALIAILDADKEGFLRSERSLIQTIGRAARNVEGKAILLRTPCAERWTKRLDAEKSRLLTTWRITSRRRASRKKSVTLLTVSTRAITSKMNSDWWTVRITKKWVRRNWHAKSNGSKTKCLSMLRISNSKKPRKSVINWLQFVNKFSARRPEKMRKVQKRTYRCSF